MNKNWNCWPEGILASQMILILWENSGIKNLTGSIYESFIFVENEHRLKFQAAVSRLTRKALSFRFVGFNFVSSVET